MTSLRRLTSLVTAITFVLFSVSNVPFSFANDKTVSKDISWFDQYDLKDSYEITTEAQLIGLSSLVNEKQDDLWKPNRLETFEGKTFVLKNDIVLTQPWTPIGKDKYASFAGTFDGDGHTISGLDVRSQGDDSGLFGYLDGEIKDLIVEGSCISTGSNTGGLAGTLSSSGRIINCTSNVTVKGTDKCGGIVGNIEGGHVEGCINTGNIGGTHKIGGVAGENRGGSILDSGNEGTIRSTRRGFATYGTGGVAGRSVTSSAEIVSCYNHGEIFSNTEGSGGIVGYINATGSTVKNCYNTGTININLKSSDKEVTPTYAGGIVGIAGIKGVTVENCYNSGKIKDADVSGGIIGMYHNDTDHMITEGRIINNQYLSAEFKRGIGELTDPRDKTLDKAVKGVMSRRTYKLDGQMILDILTPRNIVNNAAISYMEAKDKILKIKEEAQQ